MSKIKRAKNLAQFAHHGQTRKYTGEPYFNHLEEVADIIRCHPHTPAMIIAAYLHDTLEDTHMTSEILADLFGPHISLLVHWLTDSTEGNRATRKKIDRDRLAAAPADAQTIKLADLISNTKSIVEHDPNFAKVYLAEKLLDLNVLTKGDRTLHARATQLAHDGLARLENAALQKALNR